MFSDFNWCLLFTITSHDEQPMNDLCGQNDAKAIEIPASWNDPLINIVVFHVWNETIQEMLLKNFIIFQQTSHFKSRSSSSYPSKYNDPHKHARLPRIMMMKVDVTTRKTPVPRPQVIVCCKLEWKWLDETSLK